MKNIAYILLLLFAFTLFAQTPTQEWVARYLRPTGSSASANYLALDKIGNCYVLGNIPVSGSTGGMLLIKYNSTGDTVFTRTYNIGAGNACVNTSVAADSIGNVYITGYTGPTFGPYDIVLIKYSNTGIQEWVSIYNGAGNVSDASYDVKLDKNAMPYITGLSNNNPILIKYNPVTGDTIWTRQYILSGYTGVNISLGFDQSNNIYTGGTRVLTSTGFRSYLAIKYDTLGNQLWSNNSAISGFLAARKMAVDIFGNCYITGNYNGWLTVKFNSSGAQQWAKELASGDAYNLITDNNGNCYVTGDILQPGNNVDYATIKYNNFGDSVWVKKYNGPGNDNDEAYGIAIDDSENIYITGRSIGNSTSWDYATIKYNPNGVQQWVLRYNGPATNGDDIAYAVKIDKQYNIFVTGVSDRGSLLFDYATIKYNQTVGINLTSLELPEKFILYQNYPNPFNPVTKIKIGIPKSSDIKLIIFDITGKEVFQLINEFVMQGEYEISFNGVNLSSGIYFYKIISKEFIDTKKMVLIK